MKYKYLLVGCILGMFSTSCELIDEDSSLTTDTTDLEHSLGWFGSDDLSKVPFSISTNNLVSTTNSSATLPNSVDLVKYFPPIGNQGKYGTCVAWAAAYNTKTAVEAMDRGYTTSQLANTQYQLSPKDLFFNILDSQKGKSCGGTGFTSALDVLVKRGAAPLSDVPYDNLSNCASSLAQSSWDQYAKNHKIESYRKIDIDVNTAKGYLAQNRPIVFGARLADNFMSWDSDEVITSHSSFNRVGQHAYHAMVIAGYDDTKGFNGAFKVINSWGEYWGSKGYIWVDYNFMVSNFCFGGNMYVVKNDNNGVIPDKQDDKVVVTNEVDLAPWVTEDYSTYYNGEQTDYKNERRMKFNVYNIGQNNAKSSDVWSTYYIYYNAYDANDYGVVFVDEFNTTVTANDYQCSDDLTKCDVNYDIPAGSSFAKVFDQKDEISRIYDLPTNLNGYYYLVLVADATDEYKETDEANNYFYTTTEPKYYGAGYAARKGNDAFVNDKAASSSNINKLQQLPTNAYTRHEISMLLDREDENGNLRRKVDAYRKAHQNSNRNPYK